MEPVKRVPHSDIKWSSRKYKSSKAEPTHAYQQTKILDNIKQENLRSHFHNEDHLNTKQKIGVISCSAKSSREWKSKFGEPEANEDGELVKHMSKLPGYLQHMERRENLQETIFNFGVLDWERLEEWKSNPQEPHSVCSRRPPSSEEGQFESFRQTGGHAATHEHTKSAPMNASSGHEVLGRISSCRERTYSFTKTEIGRERVSQANNNPGKRACSSTLTDCEVLCFPKGAIESLRAESARKDYFHEFTLPDQDCQGRSKTIVLILPRDSSKNSSSRVTLLSKSSMPKHGIQSVTNSKNFLKGYVADEELESLSVRRKVDSRKQLDTSIPQYLHAQTFIDPSADVALLFSSNETTIQRYEKLKKPGSLSRTFSNKGSLAVPNSCSTNVQSRSGAVDQEAFVNSSNTFRAPSDNKERTSSLRRLFNPLQNVKAANNIAETLREESLSWDKFCTLPDGQLYYSIDHMKNLDSSCRAHLQIATMNGLPWFTFTVENSTEVLSATMRKINSLGKFDCHQTYTFYSCSRIKSKNGEWITHGSKERSLESVPNNIVAQMEVFRSQCPKFTRDGIKYPFVMTKFVQSSVGLKQANKEELAAIIVKEKIQRETVGCLNNYVRSGLGANSHNPFSTVAILPNGLHGTSAIGKPSPLIDRWKSGGICDCGGWDVGCKLRVLSNINSYAQQDPHNLFMQGEVEEQKKPFFCLTNLKKGFYSMAFDISVSPLQAFSICIAFLHTRNLTDLTDTLAVNNLLQG